MHLRPPAFLALALAPALAAAPTGLEDPLPLGPDEGLVTLVGTNDLHGGLTPSDKDGRVLGGLDWFAGYLAALRAHHARHYRDRATVHLLDAGDAIQGTLLSNHSEGRLMTRVMGALGYQAAIAGNHGYDFGPVGWQVDRVLPGATDANRLGALEALAAMAAFPILAANVTRKATGAPHPRFPSHVLVPAPFGRTLALIGLENPQTPRTTLPDNVRELAFGEGLEETRALVDRLHAAGTADLFVALFHEGDGKTRGLADWLARLPRRADGAPLLDAVIAGHSHALNDAVAADVPYVQSGAGGRLFGVLQLPVVRDRASGRLAVQAARRRQKAGIPIVPRPGTFLGEPVARDPAVTALIEAGRREIDALAGRVLATSPAAFTRDQGRVADSAAGNLLADMMRRVARTEVAVINSGDLREGLPAGTVTYEHLFAAVPKNLALMVMPQLPVSLLVKNLERSVVTCGRRGALQVSGITLTLRRDCETEAARETGDDRTARLLKLVTATGRVLFERRADGTVFFDPDPVSVATSDFVMEGGAGYPGFPAPAAEPGPVPLREAVADAIAARGTLDPAEHAVGRYRFVR